MSWCVWKCCSNQWIMKILSQYTAQKINFSINDFFSKCDQIRNFLQIWSHLLKKYLMENFIFCAVILLLSIETLQIFSGGVFFLTGGCGLSILESIMSNDIKCHWLYIEFLASLRLLLRIMAACFNFFFFMAKRCILGQNRRIRKLILKLKIKLDQTLKCILRNRSD